VTQSPKPRFRVIAALAVAAVVVAAAVSAWRLPRRSYATPSGAALGALPRGERPSDLNLLLITLDTTRADAIGAYGSAASRTPVIDRLAKSGALFAHAVAPAPLTLPAHASLFTSKFPPGHGVRDNGGFFLADSEVTLAERLKANGFQTGGFVGAYVLDRRWGIGQGFDTYFDDFDLSKADAAVAAVERPGNEVADAALRWLENTRSSRFFGWVHFYDAHSPYSPPPPYREQFADRPYLGEVAFVDAQIGRLLNFLESRDLLRKTIVAVVGDHGESLGEHGESTHGFFVYQAAVRVPFVILSPYDGLSGRRVEDVVRTVDLLPTILDLLGVRLEGEVDGRSLVPLMSGAVSQLSLAAYSEAMYPRHHFGWSELRALTSTRFKYIEAPRPELYDLDQDPGETRNLYEAQRALGHRIAAVLRKMEAADLNRAATPAAPIDPDARARLAALGYVATFAADTPRDRSTLADPKDKIDIFNLMVEAREQILRESEWDKGLASLQRVVARDPNVIDAWLMMGRHLARVHQYDRALDTFRRALALKPDYDLAIINMANVYRHLGRLDDALAGFKRALDLDPTNLDVRQEMAQLLIEMGRLDAASAELRTILDKAPNRAPARNSLGALRLLQGDVDGGEREIRAALARRADLPLAHFNLALVAEKRGDVKAAVTEYRREIELNPGSYKAEFNLGRLYGENGDRQAQRGMYEASIGSNPSFAEGHLFLSKLYFDLGELEKAGRAARRGLELAPEGEWAALGHFVLADAFAAQGRSAEAAREVTRGRRLAARMRR
jgi:arylsulfatase A-like enzyme/Tfp pilus assembly protein PilF